MKLHLSPPEGMETMSLDTFRKILHLLWIVGGQISALAYTNLRIAKDVQQTRLGKGSGRAEEE